MFCFCLQSPLLKLQAIDGDGHPHSPGSSPEDEAPSLGTKEEPPPSPLFSSSTCQVPASCWGLSIGSGSGSGGGGGGGSSTKERERLGSPTETQSFFRSSQQQPPHQAEGGGGGGGGGGIGSWFETHLHHPPHHHQPQQQMSSSSSISIGNGSSSSPAGPSRFLLHHITDDDSPQPSPRCPSFSQSQRFNTDPEMAPSPPCSQHHLIMARGMGRADAEEVAKDTPTIPLLTKHIQALKRKIRRFEERFEQEMNYKPSHNDKSANPEIFRLMSELAKTRKQLKELRLRQSVEELSSEPENGGTTSSSSSTSKGALDNGNGSSSSSNGSNGSNSNGGGNTILYHQGETQHHHQLHQQPPQTQPQQQQQPHRPTLEETVDSLLKRLKEKRQALGLPDNMLDMTYGQMALEKMTLQKCLLYFESLHGRPGNKQEKNLVKPLYDRYQMVKRLLCASSPITTIEEEEGSDDDCVTELPSESCPPVMPFSTEDEGDSDTAFVSPMDEIKAVTRHGTPRPPVTMANLHEASRSELLACLRETRAEKRRRRKALREFEDNFSRQTGRTPQKEDRIPLSDEYQEYKTLKAKLRLLEVLLSKQAA